jgi:hypothetical protein
MVKISKNATRNPFFILAILFAAGILYLIFRNYSFKEGQTKNHKFSVDKNGRVADKEGNEYEVDEEGNILDDNGHNTGYILDEDDEEHTSSENKEKTSGNPSRKTTTGSNPHIYHSGKIMKSVD